MVVVHHDQPVRCAATARAFAGQAGVGDVWVVDSSSRPESLARLRALAPELEIIETGGNVGFGPGANAGIRRWLADGRGDWIGVAPHDALPEPGCVEALVAAATGVAQAGLVCAEFGPGYELVPAYDHVLGGYHRPRSRGVGWEDVPYPHGTLLLARRAALEEIGLFDERYFAYCEEVDLGIRAAAAGWRVGIAWGAVVRNGSQPPRPAADYLQLRNTLLLVSSHHGRPQVRGRIVLAAAHIAALAMRQPRSAPRALEVSVRAVRDHRRGRYGAPPARIVGLGSVASNRSNRGRRPRLRA